MNDLVKKYNRQGPRYTSYPPVPFWKNAPVETSWISHLKESYKESEGLDLYVHVPYCEKLCYYCGCNRVVTKNHNVEDSYIELIQKEWKIYCDSLGFIPKVNSLHFGGGTPTFLSAVNLEKIIQFLTVNKSENFTGSIEVDPRNVTTAHLDTFLKNGIVRISLGIQDFDPGVQKAINRMQSFELVKNLMAEIRARKFESINFDIIYGLPKQTQETITYTFSLVNELRPDLIAYYSYAHLPERLSNQRLIKNEDLPEGTQKLALYETGKLLLAEKGYHDIGMDHFALPENFLCQAKNNNCLDRNFMGYVDKKSSILIGLGPSAISNSSKSFIQNSKGLTDYESRINSGVLAITSGHTHTTEDLAAQKIILELMCNEESLIDLDVHPYKIEISSELKNLEEDGLIKKTDNFIRVLPAGKKFIRNIAMVFDFHYREKAGIEKFSKTI
ncbi:MAG: oxygen-independent coproporphyrinogen III oxidase [Rhizobacter sp.]|nr:oxygen-independent coproporphyrinogen III oxidase [Bacteriovorax sp.]